MKFDENHRANLRAAWKRRREERDVGRYIRRFDRGLFVHLLYANDSYSTRAIDEMVQHLAARGYNFGDRP